MRKNRLGNATRVVAKALDSESRSDAIVVSFDAEWYERLRAKRFSAVIRKRIPATLQPKWLYFHFNSPRSALSARARVLSVEMIDEAKALSMERQLDLTADRIRLYVRPNPEIGCYRLAGIELAKRDAALQELGKTLVYYPPQSFFVLSKAAKQIIDEICGFENRRSHHVVGRSSQ